MLVVRKNKVNNHLVLDYHKLIKHVDAYIAHADVCAEKLKE